MPDVRATSNGPEIENVLGSSNSKRRYSAPTVLGQLIEPPAVTSYEDPTAVHQPTDKANFFSLSSTKQSTKQSPQQNTLTDETQTTLPLAEWIPAIEKLGSTGLGLEYDALRKEPLQGTFLAHHANPGKNRYCDVLCNDATRVVLTGSEKDGDYIHANFIDGYKHARAYICTQGPIKNTFVDFWRMIWQEQVLVIVMITRIIERGKQKCGQYWPPTKNKNFRYGAFLVSTKKIESQPDFDLSYFLIRNLKTREQRWVCHILYHAWPDCQVPKSPSAFLDFIKTIRALQFTMLKKQIPAWKGHPLGPAIVIHCSAGIGRTGTLCATDICLNRLTETGKLNISDVVRKMRTQRLHSVQNAEQYMFIHLVLIEYAVTSQLAHT